MSAARTSPARRARLGGSGTPAVAALAPMALLLACFFLLPIVGMALTAFTVSDGAGGSHLGLENFASLADRGQAIANSVKVSAIGALVGAAIGSVSSFCIAQIRSKKLDAIVAVLSSVLANDGGAPLAFSFIVTLGNTGFLFALLGLDAIGFSLYSWQGLVVMYQYFLVPTMIMVTLPTFVGLRREWQEANLSLGGSAWTFWRRVGLPVAAPALLGGWVLLFGSAYATHASAAVLIGTGGFPLVTLTIASELRSGVSSGGEEAAMALGVTMVVIAVVVLFLFNRLQRMSARWIS
ncbi:IRON(III)-TRANSPORT SYSTEM PERMEASE PROTEIN SFUB [Frigoribacterium sp. JB110]|nr:IRON(III)-TRANSPORT SYSTEM PERMEASE PROTEIN SFUB [Frigoribacterium sp. JB110]